MPLAALRHDDTPTPAFTPILVRPLDGSVVTDDAPAVTASPAPDTTCEDGGNAEPPVPSTPERRAGADAGTPEGPRPRLRLVDDFGPVHTELAALPEPAHWLRGVAIAVYEAATGARPATQVMRFVAPDVYDSIVRRSGRAARRGPLTRRPVRLRRVRAAVVPGHTSVVEGCVVVDDHRRVRVMAVRLEGLDGRWLLTACEIG